MKTILITGINGYLGSNLAKRYSKKYKIVGLEYDTYDLYRIKDDQFEVFASKDGIPDALFKNHEIDAHEFLEFVHDVNLDFLKENKSVFHDK